MIRVLRNQSIRILSALPIVAVVALSGCSDGGFGAAPVSGVVTLDGEPLSNAHVGFEPIATGESTRAGLGSYGMTDDKGGFRLTSLDQRDGAVVGKHRVTIRTLKAEAGPNGERIIVRKEIVPKRYRINTILTQEVPADGTDEANFALESGRR